MNWQRTLRKNCFELMRRTESFAVYDFLGDIDTHWHTFGYCVGMMNEFYELKPGETVANVRRYNSDTVLLADLPECRNLDAGAKIQIPILVSNYGEHLSHATLTIRIAENNKVHLRREIRLTDIKAGEITELYRLSFNMPRVQKPMQLKLKVALSGGNTDAENEWDLYVFPKAQKLPSTKALKQANITVTEDIDSKELLEKLMAGENVLLFGNGPFQSLKTSFQISIAGRTYGHLATVIADHPIISDMPNEGFCGMQFRGMLNGGCSAILDKTDIPFSPIIEIASSYKYARREALMFEYSVGRGKLLVTTLNLDKNDPGARWLKESILSYAMSKEFQPKIKITPADLMALCLVKAVEEGENVNEAVNKNDITMN